LYVKISDDLLSGCFSWLLVQYYVASYYWFMVNSPTQKVKSQLDNSHTPMTYSYFLGFHFVCIKHIVRVVAGGCQQIWRS